MFIQAFKVLFNNMLPCAEDQIVTLKLPTGECLCAGILFSTLVFGPACGFILGSLCTKFYVDAIFIDTSES